jgi:hypothetical protein
MSAPTQTRTSSHMLTGLSPIQQRRLLLRTVRCPTQHMLSCTSSACLNSLHALNIACKQLTPPLAPNPAGHVGVMQVSGTLSRRRCPQRDWCAPASTSPCGLASGGSASSWQRVLLSPSSGAARKSKPPGPPIPHTAPPPHQGPPRGLTKV